MSEGVSCAVAACPNNYTSNLREDLTYHRFPKQPPMRSAWIRACLRPRMWPGADFGYVCSDHFDETDFDYAEVNGSPKRIHIRSEAIPSAKIKSLIKSEPIDVEEELQQLIGEDDFEMILDTTDPDEESMSNKLDHDESQDLYSPDESVYMMDDGKRNICKKCNREFKTHGRLKRHELFCPPIDKKIKTGPRAGSGTTCFYKDCSAKFYHRNKMLKHMETVHNCVVDEKQKLKFASMEEFWTWKENEEERTYSYFSKRTGNHKNTATYHCQRDGPSRARSNAAENSRAAKRQLTKGNIKENIVCLAHIKTTLNDDGTVSAIYFPSHNHPLSAMDYLHHPLSRATQMFIKEKLELGYTPKQIADELMTRQKASGSHRHSHMTKNQFLHMVNKLDRIRGFLDRERKKMRDDATGQVGFRRQRRSRKVIFEEQFEKSRQYREEVRTGRQYLDDIIDFEDENTMSVDHANDHDDMYDDDGLDLTGEGEMVEGDYIEESGEGQTTEEILGAHELVKSLDGATAIICKQEDVVQELVLDESGVASSSDSHSDYQALYENARLANKQLNETVVNLKRSLSKKEKQINLLINALKKSLSKVNSDLASLKETISDGDYEIIVI